MAKVNKKELEKLYKHLKKHAADEVQISMDRVSRAAGFQVLRGAMDRSPFDTGRLRSSLNVADNNPDQIFIVSMGRNTTEVTVGTNVEYARYMEEGYTHRSGKRVPGFHFLARSLSEVESVLDELIQEELEDLKGRLFLDG